MALFLEPNLQVVLMALSVNGCVSIYSFYLFVFLFVCIFCLLSFVFFYSFVYVLCFFY